MDVEEARSGVTGLLVAAAEAPTSVPEHLAHLPALLAARAEDLIAGGTARRQL
ncbi:hypothetical protein [Pseudarthrobacter cellobiosi]|uniref:hypothetical protein n=1 Tax=Pseudarthrobacter cellobiosi TaxID=2953654 RepID=UPI00208FC89A|nr:hypothetical protein [Pseudarthrobacter sp. HLT1-5]MCO4254072.1 hypothetical protein [Pseudarthrobacter sp. HLT1-5]